MQILGVIVNGHWRPGIGDPTIMGWLAAVAYLTAAGLCGAYARRADRISATDRFGLHRPFWWSLAVIMLLMGVNKQLDIQSWFALVARRVALAQGWYSQREAFRIWVVAELALAGIVLLTWLGWALRRVWRQYALTLLGIALLAAFVVVRAAPMDHVEKSLGWWPAGTLMNWILEIGGIACVGISALAGVLRCREQSGRTVSL